jgi:hypothetical protein
MHYQNTQPGLLKADCTFSTPNMNHARADSVSDAGDSVINGCGPCDSGSPSGTASPGESSSSSSSLVSLTLTEYEAMKDELRASKAQVVSLEDQIKALEAERDTRFDQATFEKKADGIEREHLEGSKKTTH